MGVVLCGTQEDFFGMSIAWLTKVEKEHVLVSLPRGALGTQKALVDKRFTLNLLAESQIEIARQFGGSKQKKLVDKSHAVIVNTEWGIPAIRDCCSTYLCKVASAQELNEQMLVIAKIFACIDKGKSTPLTYKQSDFFV